MAKYLRVVAGIPRMSDVAVTYTRYVGSYTATGSEVQGTPITLPSGGTYSSIDLEVWLNGQRLFLGTDWLTVGAGDAKTQVTLTDDLASGDIVTFTKLS